MVQQDNKARLPISPIIIALVSLVSAGIFATALGTALGLTLYTPNKNSTDTNLIPKKVFASQFFLSALTALKLGNIPNSKSFTADSQTIQNLLNDKIRKGRSRASTSIVPILIRNLKLDPRKINSSQIGTVANMTALYDSPCDSSSACNGQRKAKLDSLFKGTEIKLLNEKNEPLFVIIDTITSSNLGQTSETSEDYNQVIGESDKVPPETQLYAMMASWQAIEIPLTKTVGNIPAGISSTTQQQQLIHDLNTLVGTTTNNATANQDVIFLNYKGTETFTSTTSPKLKLALQSYHNRGCVNCTNTLIAAVKKSLAGRPISKHDPANMEFDVFAIGDISNLVLSLVSTSNITIAQEANIYEQRNKSGQSSLVFEIEMECKSPSLASVDCPDDSSNVVALVTDGITKKIATMANDSFVLKPFAVGEVEYRVVKGEGDAIFQAFYPQNIYPTKARGDAISKHLVKSTFTIDNTTSSSLITAEITKAKIYSVNGLYRDKI